MRFKKGDLVITNDFCPVRVIPNTPMLVLGYKKKDKTVVMVNRLSRSGRLWVDYFADSFLKKVKGSKNIFSVGRPAEPEGEVRPKVAGGLRALKEK